MGIIRKDATITNVDDDFPGTFRVALSVPTKDRDGDTLLATEWKQPLPDHVTFDQDHLMSVAGTVGSGKPFIDEEGTFGAGKGALIVEGTYSSLPRAQEVRTLVKEGHINRTSVAFMTEKTQKDGKATVVRELLNGAFVAVPSNREAVILSSKAAVKAGARNSKSDAAHIQAIYDHAVALGATGGDTDRDEDVAAGKSVSRATVKTVAGSYEQVQQAISDALSTAYPDSGGDTYQYAYPLATFPGTVVYRVSGNTDAAGQWQADYTLNDDGTVTLGTAARVNLIEQIVPISGDPTEKNTDSAAGSGSAAAAKAAAADTAPTAVEDDDSIKKEAAAARFRLYATLSER